jgi:hypothetical protein
LHATRGAAAVEWRVESGTALAGVDYARMPPQILRFFDGQPVRSLFIPLIKAEAASTKHGPRQFTVVLRALPGAPALGQYARVVVTIAPTPDKRGIEAVKMAAAD